MCNRPDLNDPYIMISEGGQLNILDRKSCFLSCIVRPHVEQYWGRVFGKTINWNRVWTRKIMLKENKLSQFNFKPLHNILPNMKQLVTWKIMQDDKCILCNMVEDAEHLYTRCTNTCTRAVQESCTSINMLHAYCSCY